MKKVRYKLRNLRQFNKVLSERLSAKGIVVRGRPGFLGT